MPGGAWLVITSHMVGAWYADIDYLRLTMKEGRYDEEAYGVYGRVGRAAMAQINGGEASDVDWRWMGYSGRTGAGVSFGYGPAGAILQASGAAASVLAAVPVPWDGCPRVDVQITFWLKEYDGAVAKRIADQVDYGRREGKGRRARPKFIDGYGEGDTAYIGSRSSDRYIRVYDKERESGDTEGYAAAWRVEVEYKGELAVEVWEAAPRGGDRQDWAYGLVAAEMAAQSVLLPRVGASQRRPTLPSGRGEDRDARALRWLATQVSPSVSRLLSAGYRPDYLREILGL